MRWPWQREKQSIVFDGMRIYYDPRETLRQAFDLVFQQKRERILLACFRQHIDPLEPENLSAHLAQAGMTIDDVNIVLKEKGIQPCSTKST